MNQFNGIFIGYFPLSESNLYGKYLKKNWFLKLIYLISQFFFGLDFLKLSGPLCLRRSAAAAWLHGEIVIFTKVIASLYNYDKISIFINEVHYSSGNLNWFFASLANGITCSRCMSRFDTSGTSKNDNSTKLLVYR